MRRASKRVSEAAASILILVHLLVALQSYYVIIACLHRDSTVVMHIAYVCVCIFSFSVRCVLLLLRLFHHDSELLKIFCFLFCMAQSSVDCRHSQLDEQSEHRTAAKIKRQRTKENWIDELMTITMIYINIMHWTKAIRNLIFQPKRTRTLTNDIFSAANWRANVIKFQTKGNCGTCSVHSHGADEEIEFPICVVLLCCITRGGNAYNYISDDTHYIRIGLRAKRNQPSSEYDEYHHLWIACDCDLSSTRSMGIFAMHSTLDWILAPVWVTRACK